MTGNSPRCSIVIRAYNEGQHLGRLLSGITQQTLDDCEIILVDSGSTDNTVDIAQSYDARIVHIQPEEFTFGRSLNLGIEHAQGELIVLASAHIYPVYPDWLEHLLAPFIDPQVALTYGKQRGAPDTHFSEHQVFARWFPDHSQAWQAHPFCNNANAAVRRALWQQQPYDETLPGLEDLAWATEILKKGFAISYVAEAEIIHVHNELPRQVFNRYRREAIAFKRIFPHEQFHLIDFLRLYLTNVISDFWHAARQRAPWRRLGSIFWFRRMQFWGTYMGYRHSGPLTWQLRQTFYYPHSLTTRGSNQTRRVQPIQYDDVINPYAVSNETYGADRHPTPGTSDR